MANTDNSEWRLLDVDTVTHLAVLPIGSSHLYQELNAPGSGELKIPLDSAIAANISEGMFCQLRYRGSIRDGFFIENIQETEADPGEGESRWLSVSGRGALALLDRAQVWADSTGTSSREFTSVTKAYILKTLIDEAQARGALANLTYDFTATQDSSGAAWSDSENYTIPVGKKLLELAKQFASTGGFDFSLDLSAGTFNLHAYLAGVGTDKHTTIYFRIGEQAEEVGQDQRAGPDLVNAYLIKHQQGFSAVEDATSIASNGRAEGFLNLEQAQSSASALTYASAKLALYKDPLQGKTLKVYDGVAPRLFVDYVLGDTVTIDKFGVESSDRILGVKADFDGVDFSHVVLEMNYLFQEEDIKLANELDNLLTDWNTARDANLLEVMEGLAIGANGLVNAIHTYGDYIYIGGGFTFVNGIASSYTIRYQISSHTWTELTGISAAVIKIVDVAGTIYACTSTKVYVLSGTAWSLVGTATGTLRCMTSDGTSLYVGGSLTLMDAVTINGKVAKRTAGVWTDMEPNPIIYFAESIEYFNGAIHVGFGGVPGPSSSLKYMSGGSYTNALNLGGKYIFGLKKVGSNLIIMSNDNNGVSASTCTIYSWDGVSIGPGIGSAIVIGTITDFLPVATGVGNGSCGIANYLTDVYIGADFDTLDGVTGYNGIAKYSGGIWSTLNGGVSTASGDGVTAVEIVGNDLYAGGIFTTAFGVTTDNLSVFVTDFQSLVDHLANDQTGFDMGAAIHAATAASLTDASEIPFWDSVTSALRKITWANIKATMKTYFDAIYAPIAKGVTNGDSHDHNGGDGAAIVEAAITLADNTTNNASTSAHGFLKKLSNVLNEFMDGQGDWRTISQTNIFGGHGNGGTVPAGSTNYICPMVAGIDTVGRSYPIPLPGTLRDLYFRLASAQPASGTLVLEIFAGASGTTATGIKITIAAGSAAGTYSDTTHTASHTAGDLVTVKVINNATGASGVLGGVSFSLSTTLA